jgi:hypothetical protein
MRVQGTLGYSELLERLEATRTAIKEAKNTDAPTVGFLFHDASKIGEKPVLESLIAHLKGQLESGRINISDLHLTSDRRPDVVKEQLDRLFYRLQGLADDTSRALELHKEELDPAAVRAKAKELGVAPEAFQAACEKRYREMIEYRQLDRADRFAQAFAGIKDGYGFDPNAIPKKILDQAYAKAAEGARSYLQGESLASSIETLVALNKKGYLGAQELESLLKSAILSYIARDKPVPEPLKPYRAMVSGGAAFEARRETAAELLRLAANVNFEAFQYRIEVPNDEYNNITPKLAVLDRMAEEELISRAEIEEALTKGFLRELAKEGVDSPIAKALAPRVRPSKEEKDRAIAKKVEQLAQNPNGRDEWFASMLAHRQYFPKGIYTEVLKDTAYYALVSGNEIPKQVREQVTGLDEAQILARPAACHLNYFAKLPNGHYKAGHLDLRAELRSRGETPLDRKLGDLLCDVLGHSTASYMMSAAIDKLPEILKRASSPPVEVSDPWEKLEEARASRARAYFGGKIPQNIWADLSGLRDRAEKILRDEGVSMDKDKKD